MCSKLSLRRGRSSQKSFFRIGARRRALSKSLPSYPVRFAPQLPASSIGWVRILRSARQALLENMFAAPLLEILAHEKLMPALRSAFHYVLAVRSRAAANRLDPG